MMRIQMNSSEVSNLSQRLHKSTQLTKRKRKYRWREETTLIPSQWKRDQKTFLILLIRKEATRKTLWEASTCKRINMLQRFLRILTISKILEGCPKSQFKWKDMLSRIRIHRWEMDLILLHHISREMVSGINLFTCHRKNSKYREPVKDFKWRSAMIKIWSRTTCCRSFLITKQKLRKRKLWNKNRTMLRSRFIRIMVKYPDILTATINIVRMLKSVEWSK